MDLFQHLVPPNPRADDLLAALGLVRREFGKFLDAWASDAGRVYVLTGNRRPDEAAGADAYAASSPYYAGREPGDSLPAGAGGRCQVYAFDTPADPAVRAFVAEIAETTPTTSPLDRLDALLRDLESEYPSPEALAAQTRARAAILAEMATSGSPTPGGPPPGTGVMPVVGYCGGDPADSPADPAAAAAVARAGRGLKAQWLSFLRPCDYMPTTVVGEKGGRVLAAASTTERAPARALAAAQLMRTGLGVDAVTIYTDCLAKRYDPPADVPASERSAWAAARADRDVAAVGGPVPAGATPGPIAGARTAVVAFRASRSDPAFGLVLPYRQGGDRHPVALADLAGPRAELAWDDGPDDPGSAFTEPRVADTLAKILAGPYGLDDDGDDPASRAGEDGRESCLEAARRACGVDSLPDDMPEPVRRWAVGDALVGTLEDMGFFVVDCRGPVPPEVAAYAAGRDDDDDESGADDDE